MRRDADSLYGPPVAHSYPPLNLEVRTPRLVLAGATDELLERLIPVVRAGVVGSGPYRARQGRRAAGNLAGGTAGALA